MTLFKLPPPSDRDYWDVIVVWGKKWTDGCTGVKDWYVEACYEHDFHYTYRKTLWGDPLTRDEADSRFREQIQARSPFKRFSPMSWWRYLAVRRLGDGLWGKRAIERPEVLDNFPKV